MGNKDTERQIHVFLSSGDIPVFVCIILPFFFPYFSYNAHIAYREQAKMVLTTAHFVIKLGLGTVIPHLCILIRNPLQCYQTNIL